MTPDPETIAAYVRALETASRETLPELMAWFAPDARFVDPFNDVTGAERIRRIFDKMFADAAELRFEVHDRAIGDAAAYLRWTFAIRPRRGRRTWTIEGMSEIRFDGDGRVVLHHDHWDAASQLYAKLPVLGPVLRALARRIGG